MARALHLLLVLAALAGCSATRHLAPDPGALAATDADAARITRVQRIGRDLALATAAPERFDLGLSARDGLGAWSWPDGRIRVSRALVDALDDDELRAAVAHEVGHLLDAGAAVEAGAALAGTTGGARHDASGIEERADGFACALLRARSADVAALPRMLRTVASRSSVDGDDVDPAQLLRRARVAERTCTSPR